MSELTKEEEQEFEAWYGKRELSLNDLLANQEYRFNRIKQFWLESSRLREAMEKIRRERRLLARVVQYDGGNKQVEPITHGELNEAFFLADEILKEHRND